MAMFKRIAIIGTGLIGGSMGLGIKKKRLAEVVVGVTSRPKTLREAIQRGAIDRGTLDIKSAVNGANLIILAAPVNTILRVAAVVVKSAPKGAIIIDVGSTKSAIVRRIEKILPKDIYFVGTHPLAGLEKSGVLNAQSSLFKNSLCIITPTLKTNPLALRKVKSFWQKLGATTRLLSCREHDRIVALTSHLPHIVAFSLINAIPSAYLGFSASGLRDATRLAASDAEIWSDICLSNQKEILQAIGKFEKSLAHFKSLIARKSSPALQNTFLKTKIKRQKLTP